MRSDALLARQTGAGSAEAFEAIVVRYEPELLRYCTGLAGESVAEDLVQDTFASAYVALRSSRRVDRLRPWLYRIAHNAAANALRERDLRRRSLPRRALAAPDPHAAVERRERIRAIVATVQRLSPRQREALILRELGGCSYDEIAGRLAITRGAVRQLLSRARAALHAPG